MRLRRRKTKIKRNLERCELHLRLSHRGDGLEPEVTDEDEEEEGKDKENVVDGAGCGGGVALVLLAEAHLAPASTLRHTDVVHHEVVDLEAVRAATTDFGLRCKKEEDATAFHGSASRSVCLSLQHQKVLLRCKAVDGV